MTETAASRTRWWALLVLAGGLSLIVLDGTIVGVALPTIISDLHLDLAQAEWVSSLYSVVFAALLLGAGRLGDRLGRRHLFVAGVVVFVAGSLLAAAAHSGGALIAARAVQGIGGAFVLPTSLATVNAVFREGRERAAAFGVWGAVMAGMAAVGPLLGGWLTSRFSWPWIFWVNLPLGALIIAGALLVVPSTRSDRAERGFDLIGLALSAAGFGVVVYGLIGGVRWGLLLLGLAIVAAFVAYERWRASRGVAVILGLGLFRLPTFAWGNLTAFAVAVGEFALVLVLPLYLVDVLGLGVMGAGWVLAAMALGAFASGAGARHLALRLTPPGVVVLGLVLELAGVIVTALVLGPATSPWLVAATLVVYGVGLGLASAQLTSTVLAGVPTASSGQGSATQSTVRQLGSALGTAVAGATLAAALRWLLPAKLAAAGVAGAQADGLVESTVSSVGGVIVAMRERVAAGQGGPQGADVVQALSQGFAQASSVALAAAAVFLAAGLLGAIQVARVSRARATDPVAVTVPAPASLG